MGRGTFGAVVVLALLTGCSTSSPGDRVADPAPTASPVVPTPSPVVVPEGARDFDTGAPAQTQVPDPQWDPAAREQAASAAAAAMAAFARPDLDPGSWWAELAPLLSAQGQMDYQYVDPAVVPARAVTGPGQVLDETSALVAPVAVPTDVGTYEVIVSRTDAGAPWLVERLTPPEGAS
ncbi:hypothetical protein [Actinotalea sp. C106]|uniref:hypothetical protein n=1 Tax=Actinotalea sp. C106 TaxID=2908644 RepID=UPI0020284EB0|nr:hypothetical protein [Actinotalea sp. C106]